MTTDTGAWSREKQRGSHVSEQGEQGGKMRVQMCRFVYLHGLESLGWYLVVSIRGSGA